ncbi:hypothetical protein V5O48_018662, partial [Marasmius crinis-equi]
FRPSPRKRPAGAVDEDKDGEDEEGSEDEEEEEDVVPANEEEAEAFIELGKHVSSRSEDPGRDDSDERALEDAESEMDSMLNNRGVDIPIVTLADQRLAQGAFRKARKMAKKIHYSGQLKRKLEDICKHRGIAYKSIKRIMEVRWSTLSMMLESILPLRLALDEICDNIQYTSSGQPRWGTTQKGKNPLQGLKLMDEEWNLFDVLQPLLLWYRDATSDLETNKRPLLFEVIRYMDGVNRLLEDFINDTTKPAICKDHALFGRGVYCIV